MQEGDAQSDTRLCCWAQSWAPVRKRHDPVPHCMPGEWESCPAGGSLQTQLAISTPEKLDRKVQGEICWVSVENGVTGALCMPDPGNPPEKAEWHVGSSCASECHTQSRKWFDLIWEDAGRNCLTTPSKYLAERNKQVSGQANKQWINLWTFSDGRKAH